MAGHAKLNVADDELEEGLPKSNTKSFKVWLTVDHLYWLDQQVIRRKVEGQDIDESTGRRINVNRSTILRDLIDSQMNQKEAAA
jgi:hypothetical protein